MDTTGDLLANVDYVLCLHSLGKSPLKLHMSKPPQKKANCGMRPVSSAELKIRRIMITSIPVRYCIFAIYPFTMNVNDFWKF